MRAQFRQNLIRPSVAALFLAIVLPVVTTNAQETKKSTLRGAGFGALVGQVIGKDTESTLIGAAIGGGVGHVIGNEKDKQQAQQLSQATASSEYKHDQVAQLGDTVWKVESLTPSDIIPKFLSMVVVFRHDGALVTLTTYDDGEVVLRNETYRVVDDTLVINKPGYLINARFSIDNGQLVASAENFSAVLSKLEPKKD
jgi:hypothetical protein